MAKKNKSDDLVRSDASQRRFDANAKRAAENQSRGFTTRELRRALAWQSGDLTLNGEGNSDFHRGVLNRAAASGYLD